MRKRPIGVNEKRLSIAHAYHLDIEVEAAVLVEIKRLVRALVTVSATPRLTAVCLAIITFVPLRFCPLPVSVWGGASMILPKLNGVVYDNAMGADELGDASTALGGGSISIKK